MHVQATLNSFPEQRGGVGCQLTIDCHGRDLTNQTYPSPLGHYPESLSICSEADGPAFIRAIDIHSLQSRQDFFAGMTEVVILTNRQDHDLRLNSCQEPA